MSWRENLGNWISGKRADVMPRRLYRGAGQTRAHRYWYANPSPWEFDVSRADHQKLLAFGRRLYANSAPVQAAIRDLATYAVGTGWVPQFQGKDRTWADQAERLVWEWLKVADVRGQPYDFHQDLWMCSVALDRDGDVFVLFTEEEYPQIQIVPAHAVGSRQWAEEIKTGPYQGLIAYNGVVCTKNGRAVAYQILGRSEAEDRYVSARDCIHVFDADFADQYRGVPSIAAAISDMHDYDDIMEYTRQAVKLDSSVGLIEHNEAGEPAQDVVTDTTTDSDGNSMHYEEIAGVGVRYFRAGTGAKLEAFSSERPHANAMEFSTHIIRGALASMGWPLELTWDGSKLGSAVVRLVIGRAMRTVARRQRLLETMARRVIGWRVAKAIKAGDLTANPEWWNWEFQKPEKISIDAGRDANQDREDLKIGLSNMRELYGRRGLDWQEEIKQKIAELQFITTEAGKAGVEPGAVMQTTPNATEKPAGGSDDDSVDTEKEGEDEN